MSKRKQIQTIFNVLLDILIQIGVTQAKIDDVNKEVDTISKLLKKRK